MKTSNSVRVIGRNLILLTLFLSFLTGPLLADKKLLRVSSETAHIYLNPDKNSHIVATVEKGTLLTLRHTRKFKRVWNQVIFTSEKSGTKAGYVHDSDVERLFVVTNIATLYEEDKQEKQFREARWGMSREEVIRLEGAPDQMVELGELEMMLYQERIKEMDCFIEYIFDKDRLIKGKYNFFVKHEYKNDYFRDYKKVKEYLTEIHGKPPLDNINWLNPQHKEDYSKWGLALSLGHLEYNSLWSSEKTEIKLRLYGEKEQIKLEAEYKEVESDEKKQETDALLKFKKTSFFE